jgi:hypothetical protein
MTRGRRITAARYLKTLATIEKLNALGNESEVRRLLAGVDPVEARELADELDVEPEGELIPLHRAAMFAFFPESLRA